ncbi:hypothetical protein [Archangium sp.]|uniref:hypothetical protein n=1 Tax=Archangium sp. TaxID=1872627 RepID=UPI00286C3C97|nr:hypothetical protein [Archangium sp.]
MLPPTDPNEPTPQELLPEHLTFSTRDRGLEVSRRWKSVTLLLLSSFCCFGSCGLYGQGLVAGTVRNMRNGQFVGYTKVPWLGYLMMGVSVLLTVLILYVVLLSLVNHITVRAEPGRLRVLHHPLPWPPGTLDFRARDIRFETLPGLQVKQRGGPHLVPPTFILVAVDRRGGKHELVPGLTSKEQAAWLAAELQRVMAERVPG